MSGSVTVAPVQQQNPTDLWKNWISLEQAQSNLQGQNIQNTQMQSDSATKQLLNNNTQLAGMLGKADANGNPTATKQDLFDNLQNNVNNSKLITPAIAQSVAAEIRALPDGDKMAVHRWLIAKQGMGLSALDRIQAAQQSQGPTVDQGGSVTSYNRGPALAGQGATLSPQIQAQKGLSPDQLNQIGSQNVPDGNGGIVTQTGTLGQRLGGVNSPYSAPPTPVITNGLGSRAPNAVQAPVINTQAPVINTQAPPNRVQGQAPVAPNTPPQLGGATMPANTPDQITAGTAAMNDDQKSITNAGYTRQNQARLTVLNQLNDPKTWTGSGNDIMHKFQSVLGFTKIDPNAAVAQDTIAHGLVASTGISNTDAGNILNQIANGSTETAKGALIGLVRQQHAAVLANEANIRINANQQPQNYIGAKSRSQIDPRSIELFHQPNADAQQAYLTSLHVSPAEQAQIKQGLRSLVSNTLTSKMFLNTGTPTGQ